MKTISDVQAATDVALLAFWNENNPKQFKSFPNGRAEFEEWCVELVAELEEEEANGEVVETAKPSKAIPHLASGILALQLSQMANLRGAPTSKDSDVGVEKVAKPANKVTPRTTNADGVAASWKDSAVSTARLTRDGVNVTVGGVTTSHRSVNEAFRAHTLPTAKHIRFRLKLKASKAEVFEHEGRQYHFTIG
jgi:hypothetical protein